MNNNTGVFSPRGIGSNSKQFINLSTIKETKLLIINAFLELEIKMYPIFRKLSFLKYKLQFEMPKMPISFIYSEFAYLSLGYLS